MFTHAAGQGDNGRNQNRNTLFHEGIGDAVSKEGLAGAGRPVQDKALAKPVHLVEMLHIVLGNSDALGVVGSFDQVVEGGFAATLVYEAETEKLLHSLTLTLQLGFLLLTGKLCFAAVAQAGNYEWTSHEIKLAPELLVLLAHAAAEITIVIYEVALSCFNMIGIADAGECALNGLAEADHAGIFHEITIP